MPPTVAAPTITEGTNQRGGLRRFFLISFLAKECKAVAHSTMCGDKLSQRKSQILARPLMFAHR